MFHRFYACFVAVSASCLLLGSCVSVNSPSAAAGPPLATAAVPVNAGERHMQLRPEASQVRIYVFRAGLAPKLGHNHVLSAPKFEGDFFLSDAGPAASRFALRFRLDELVFDLPEHRAALGPAFAAEISEAARQGTRENMLGEKNFQADRFPEVRIQSLAIAGEMPRFAARLAVEMHGQTREMWVPLTVTGLPQSLQVSGSLVLRQTDFGVQPYSVLNGLIAVQDAVVVEFTLKGQ